MRALMTLAAAVLIIGLTATATPAQAGDIEDYAVTSPELTRYELVYQLATKACPAARLAQNSNRMTAPAFLKELSRRAGFTTDENILLSNYCLMWVDGRMSK